MPYLVDTNVVSELRMAPRCHPLVQSWYDVTPLEELYLSVLTLGEIRRGVEKRRARDARAAGILEKWLGEVLRVHQDRILEVNSSITEIWGHLSVDPHLPPVDGLLAATAIHHRLTVATRNEADFQRVGVDYFNPFTGGTL